MKKKLTFSFVLLLFFSVQCSFAGENPGDRIKKLLHDSKKEKTNAKLYFPAELSKKKEFLQNLKSSRKLFQKIPDLAYDRNYNEKNEWNFETGLGLTSVDSTNFYLFNAFPSYTTKDETFQAKLNIPLRFATKGFDFRKDDYKTGTQVLSALNLAYNYVSYDRSFGLTGNFREVKEQSMGKGSIMYQYNNSTSYEDRKGGVDLSMAIQGSSINFLLADITKGGVVGADFNLELMTLLGEKNSRLDIPVLKHFFLGFNYGGDFNEKAGITKIDSLTGAIREDKGAMHIIDTYAQMRLFDEPNFNIELYGDYSKIMKFGSNFMAGLDFNFTSKAGSLSLSAQRRFQQGKYLPTYFDAFYETDRFQDIVGSNGRHILNSKAALLDSLEELQGSTLAQAFGEIGKQLYVLGAYQKIDKGGFGGEIYLVAALPKAIEKTSIYGGYYKRNIQDASEIFTLNQDAYFFGRLDYLLNDFMVFSLSYQQTFAPVRDAQNNIVDFTPQKRFQPELNFILPLGR
ncbi:MAG: hypothetical protein JSS63_04130 [Bacteroidetes bacterium]|nr:hypothetical protein [Bacteroidota bacterium]